MICLLWMRFALVKCATHTSDGCQLYATHISLGCQVYCTQHKYLTAVKCTQHISDGYQVYTTHNCDGCQVYAAHTSDGCQVHATHISDGCQVYAAHSFDGCQVYTTHISDGISKSKLLYGWQSVSQSVSQYVLVSSTFVGLATRYYFLSEFCCLKFAVLYLWSALSDERTDLQFAVLSLNGPSPSEPVTIFYCLIWLPQPGGLGSRIYIPQEQGGRLIPRALVSLYVVSYDSQGYGGGILTLPLPGGTGHCIHSLQE
jgi:hypothetical protein